MNTLDVISMISEIGNKALDNAEEDLKKAKLVLKGGTSGGNKNP